MLPTPILPHDNQHAHLRTLEIATVPLGRNWCPGNFSRCELAGAYPLTNGGVEPSRPTRTRLTTVGGFHGFHGELRTEVTKERVDEVKQGCFEEEIKMSQNPYPWVQVRVGADTGSSGIPQGYL